MNTGSARSASGHAEGELRELATDGFFVFIGFFPNNQLVPAVREMNGDGYVVTDGKM